ncbi:MAG: flippase [Actinomycetota bacterium]|nr:flippase [Actinomycetota bacterium]
MTTSIGRDATDSSDSVTIRGRMLAKNTLLNIGGQAIPLIVSIVSIPYVVKYLGVPRFGLLSLALNVVTYFSILDFGLDRATTRFVAEALGRGDRGQVAAIVWSAALAQFAFGLVASGLLAVFTPVVTTRLLDLDADLLRDAQTTLYVLAVAVPILMLTDSLQGVLEATQRFDLVNFVRTPASCMTFLMPTLGAWLRLSLPAIMVLLLVARIAVLLAYCILCMRQYPDIVRPRLPDTRLLRRLLAFGSWITIAGVATPILTYSDRVIIGSVVGIGAVAYYTAASDIIRRLGTITTGAGATLFPAFSTLQGAGDSDRITEIFQRSVKYLILMLGVVATTIIVFAHDILRVWLGPEFARQGSIVLQVLAGATLVNAVAWVPYSLLQAVGRAALVAKIELATIPLSLGILYFLARWFGIPGAAWGVAIRLVIDSVLLFFVCARVQRRQLGPLLLRHALVPLALFAAFASAAFFTYNYAHAPASARVLAVFAIGLAGGTAVWRWILEQGERDFCGEAWCLIRGRITRKR